MAIRGINKIGNRIIRIIHFDPPTPSIAIGNALINDGLEMRWTKSRVDFYGCLNIGIVRYIEKH